MACILVHALVGVDAHRAGVRQPKGASRRHPALHEIAHQPFTKLQLQGLDQPTLPDVEREQRTRDHAKDTELSPKLMKILVRQRVIERLIPGVQPDLAISRHCHDQENGDRQGDERTAHGRGP
jgi:hypothetical protein